MNHRTILVPFLGAVILFAIGLAVFGPRTLGQARNQPSTSTPSSAAPTAELPPFTTGKADQGVTRQAQLHTELPDRPRFQIVRYTIQAGDTAWSIAQKFGLRIESILWGNEGMSADAGQLTIGREINILPEDGVLHTVTEDDTLEHIETMHGVPARVFLAYPGNHFPENGPYELRPGQRLIIPGGKNPVTWIEPGPKIEPGKGRKSTGFYQGDLVTMGTGAFIYPVQPVVVTQPFWEGHPAIDFDTEVGQPVYASDSGTVIFSGWSESGYGKLIIIDHGNGLWTYYAHNQANLVSEGQGVLQGQQIAESGSTGRSSGAHVDFRIRRDSANFIDPTGFLP